MSKREKPDRIDRRTSCRRTIMTQLANIFDRNLRFAVENWVYAMAAVATSRHPYVMVADNSLRKCNEGQIKAKHRHRPHVIPVQKLPVWLSFGAKELETRLLGSLERSGSDSTRQRGRGYEVYAACNNVAWHEIELRFSSSIFCRKTRVSCRT